MLTRLCRSLRLRRPPRRGPSPLIRRLSERSDRAQVLVVFAVSLLALIFFIGLAVDAGAIYVTYGQLKRAVDSASVAAANDFKKGYTREQMEDSARQVLIVHQVDLDRITLNVYICDNDGDGARDADLQTNVPQFFARCPDTANGESPRKFVWVDASMKAPFYFLSLLGFQTVDLSTNAISEAAPIDLLIVLDISESMGVDTPGYTVNDFNPAGCNANTESYDDDDDAATTAIPIVGNCAPLIQAKKAAIKLVDTLYDGYDSVSVVTFDQVAYQVPIADTYDMAAVKQAIGAIALHDDPPYNRLWDTWKNPGRVNLSNPEDRDGDGADYDNPAVVGYTCPTFTANDGTEFGPPEEHYLDDRWWQTGNPALIPGGEGAPDPFGWGGVPCDRDDKIDAYDWDRNGKWTQYDHDTSGAWLTANDPDGAGPLSITLSPLSTCTGCGIRVAANVLRQNGRPSSVWVMVLLSDGAVNLSDTHLNAGELNGEDVIPSWFPMGFCTGRLFGPCVKDFGVGAEDGSATDGYWCSACQDNFKSTRYCVDHEEETCPDDTTWIGDTWTPNTLQKRYSVYDYALDMTDEAALTRSTKLTEPAGNDIAIYSIGLGAASSGADLLRYLAAVGDDGDRTTDPCAPYAANPTRDCGQYYFADTSYELQEIFEDIASRIYTRITD